ncbi:AAA family ATPase [Psychromonas arctica]|uniref:AAA family ATPase n=1 Tax=Psychromonas arctica TaxID=168275 RepID=UPI0004029078|nr:AAA family ATPase [Psychromonas arctica]
MKLQKLTLENFRGFKHFECEFQPGINVLVGLNGHGKTSILDAVSVAYGQFMSGFGTSTDRPIRDNDIHLGKTGSEDTGFTMECQFPVQVSAQAFNDYVDDFPTYWSRSRNTQKSKGSKVIELNQVAKRLQKLVQDGAHPTLPVIACYGTERLWNQSFDPAKNPPKLSKTSRLEGYRDWNKPTSSYKNFASWLHEETMASFERGMLQQEQRTRGSLIVGNIHADRLTSLQKALNIVLMPSGWSNIHYSATAKQVVATHKEQGNVPISLLSDGVRNMIGMIADIARRAIQLNPHMGTHAVQETQGIVLIDEVDMHLHPQWQQLVLKNLTEAFPKIQFIVTTHSPQVLTTVKKHQIIILQRDHVTSPIGNTYGEPSNYVLNQVLGVDSRPPLDHSKLLQEYLVLIESGLGKEKEAVEMREILKEMIGESHSDLMAADRAIQRKDILG